MISRAVLFALLLTVLTTGMARAQTGVEPSTGEDVAIAFFKTAGTQPDFNLWAKGSKEFKSVASANVDEFIHEEKQRLMRRWQNYDTKENILEIVSNVDLSLKTTMDEKGNEFYWMKISLGKDDDSVYFPYEFQDYNFAVIPQLIETMLTQQLQKEQFELIRRNFDEKLTGYAKIYLQLKPAKAYINQPYKIDGADQWAFLTDVATISIKSPRDGTVYWTYSANWYVSPVTETVRDLYKTVPQNAAPSVP